MNINESLTLLLGPVWKRRLMPVAILSIVGIAASLVFAVFIPRTYRVEVVLAPVTDGNVQGGALGNLLGGMGGGLAALAGLPLSGGGQKNEAIAILRSKAFTQEFIQQRNLLPILFSSYWDPQRKVWTVDKSDIPTLADGYRLMEKQIRKVAENKTTGLVTLTIDWRDRFQAAEWADGMVAQLNEEMRRRAIDDAKRSLEYLNDQLAKTPVVGLQQAIYRLVESQMNRQMLAQVRQEYAFRTVDGALPPDEKDPIWPRRRIIAPLGAMIGFILGAFWVVIAERIVWRRQ